MAYLQLKQEQKRKALIIRNQKEGILLFSDRANQYRKHHLKDDNLERANKPQNATNKTSIIGEKAQKLLAVLRGKFRCDRKELILNDNYIAQITKRKLRQNINIINQIPAIEFMIKRDRKLKSYVITKVKNEESSLQKIAKSNVSQSVETKRIQGSPNKNNNSRRIRSKFLNNSKVGSKNVIRYQKYKSYEKAKDLKDHYPLNQEDCYELQKRSNKKFNLKAMNEILLAMSRKTKLKSNSFNSKALFMAYMTKVFQKEDREVDKANSPTFRIISGRSESEIVEILTLNQKEKYLNQVENSAIHSRSDYTQFRARIAGQFPINLAYSLLKNMIDIKKQDDILEIAMYKEVPLSEHYKLLLLNHAKSGGYAGVNQLEIKNK